MGKTFTSASAEATQTPIKFDIEGEEFEVPRPLPGFILLDFAALSGAEGSDAIKAYAQFFTAAFANDGEYKRFRLVCAQKRVPLKADMQSQSLDEDELSLLSIAQYVISEASGHPTEQRPDSLEPVSLSGTASDTAA